jgi:hypothetical protein
MRTRLIITLMVLWPILVIADVKWQKFAVSDQDQHGQAVTIGAVSAIIKTRSVKDAWFPEDNLILTVRGPKGAESKLWFESSYGMGAVAIHDDVILLKYGVGRGTAGSRVEHVKVLALNHSLEELFDVQISYWVESRNPGQLTPDPVEYRIKIEKDRAYTTFTFWTPEPRKGIPSEKIVRLKNDG